jgi:hypothetical protein
LLVVSQWATDSPARPRHADAAVDTFDGRGRRSVSSGAAASAQSGLEGGVAGAWSRERAHRRGHRKGSTTLTDSPLPLVRTTSAEPSMMT